MVTQKPKLVNSEEITGARQGLKIAGGPFKDSRDDKKPN